MDLEAMNLSTMPSDLLNLKGQTVVVTGATAGIGKALALHFAKHGAFVAVVGTNEDRGTKVVSEISEIDGNGGSSFFKVNVASFSEVDEFCKKILELRGQIDVLVNNAGITKDQLLMKMSEDDWDSVIDVNVKSCFNLCRNFVRAFIKQRKGRIINISSVVGLTGNAGQVNYAASKSAIVGFTKALAKELAPRNILVNCIAPGFITTPMTEVMTEAQKTATLEQIPLKRMGSTDDIAYAALFLASPMSAYMTGQVLVVDGGMVM